MARYGLDLTMQQLSELTKVSVDTISRIESDDEKLKERTIEDVRRALETLGAQFLDENGGPPGVRLPTQKKKKKKKKKK